jgi:hypothetical protein
MFKKTVGGKVLVDFILESVNTRVLVIMARDHDFQQGIADALIGCEILAHLSRVNNICAVVKDYMEWTVIKRHVQCSLHLTPDGPADRESLQEITEKINGMLN